MDQINNLTGDQQLKAIIHKCRNLFEKNYTVSIQNLLRNFPADYKDDKGVKFWTAPKMCPDIIHYSNNNEDHVNFLLHSFNV